MPRWYVFAVALTAGCSTVDRPVLTDFVPIDDSHYAYVATADAAYPEDSESAEATRMDWLEKYLRDNGGCPETYVITNRQVIFVQEGLLADIKRIRYTVECP